MSGHSKWSSIKHKKGAQDAKRGQLFSKLSRAIIVAAREGGADPDANATLAAAIQKARDNSMPKDNIERAIVRGTGPAGDAEAYETVTYEGYGPNGVAVSSRRSRTIATARRPTSATSSGRTTAISARAAPFRGSSSARA